MLLSLKLSSFGAVNGVGICQENEVILEQVPPSHPHDGILRFGVHSLSSPTFCGCPADGTIPRDSKGIPMSTPSFYGCCCVRIEDA